MATGDELREMREQGYLCGLSEARNLIHTIAEQLEARQLEGAPLQPVTREISDMLVEALHATGGLVAQLALPATEMGWRRLYLRVEVLKALRKGIA